MRETTLRGSLKKESKPMCAKRMRKLLMWLHVGVRAKAPCEKLRLGGCM